MAVKIELGILLPNPPPVYSLMKHDLVGRDADPPRDRRDRLHRALCRRVHVQLAVLPVRHRGTRFERLVAGRLRHERFVEHEVGLLEAFVDVADHERVCELADRHLTRARLVEVVFRPLPDHDLRRRRRCRRRGRRAGNGGRGRGRRERRTHPDVALRPCVRTVRAEAFNRIDDEGQRLEFDLDLFDRFRRGELVDGGDRQNRLALIERLVRQAAFRLRGRLHVLAKRGAGGRTGHVVRGEDGLDAGHRERGARVEPRDARVRHGAREELAEQHAVDAEVLGVLGSPGDFRDEIRCRVVFADTLVRHGLSLSSRTLRRASWP